MDGFRQRLSKSGIDVALVTDDDNVYYLTGYCDYLHMDFGRLTILIVHRDGPSVLVTSSTAPKIWEASNQSGQQLGQVILAQVAEGGADIEISCLEFDFVRSIRVWDVRHYSHREMDLSRFCAAPSARLSHFPLERDGAFPSQC
jgi:Xaa-Pro aminopeptidase